jgi:hypothetical protein
MDVDLFMCFFAVHQRKRFASSSLSSLIHSTALIISKEHADKLMERENEGT